VLQGNFTLGGKGLQIDADKKAHRYQKAGGKGGDWTAKEGLVYPFQFRLYKGGERTSSAQIGREEGRGGKPVKPARHSGLEKDGRPELKEGTTVTSSMTRKDSMEGSLCRGGGGRENVLIRA